MRADLYLHHVRIFKTRSLATKSCDKGQVLLEDKPIKPARILKPGDLLKVQRGDLALVLQVTGFPEKRVGFPLVAQFMENLTPAENYQKAAAARQDKVMTAPHDEATKPNKKQMREIRKWMEQIAESDTL